MHAYDFILILLSFVYAAAIAHLLSTTGGLIISVKRIRLSWFNAGWMFAALLFTCAWWIGLWDLHAVKVWDIGTIAFYFSIAAGIYLLAQMVSPRIPEKDDVDLKLFHAEQGRKYLIVYTVLGVVTVITNAVLGSTPDAMQWSAQNLVIAPMTVAAGVAALFIKRVWIQVLALIIQIGGWIWYFAVLQTALAG